MAVKARDYQQEYRDYLGMLEQIKERAQWNVARADMELKKSEIPRRSTTNGPYPRKGTNSKQNLRAVSQDTNCHKGASSKK